MRLFIVAILAFMAGISSAAMSPPQQPKYLVQSTPFNLIVLSSNSTLNGTHLYACHEGAAIQGLCTNSSRVIREGPNPERIAAHTVRFFLNTTAEPAQPGTDLSDTERGPGILTWSFVHMTVSLGMTFYQKWCTNVITPLFTPGSAGTVMVSFDKDDKLFMWNWRDESELPNWANMGYTRKAYYNWYICRTNAGYLLETVTWLTGGVPLNPSCQKVDIKRVPERSY